MKLTLLTFILSMGLAFGYSGSLEDYYRGQETDSSCSVASAAMVVNAIIDNDEFMTEEEILTHSGSQTWMKAVAPDGDGLTLEIFANELAGLFLKLKLSYEVVFVHMDSVESEALFRKALLKDYVIMNFDQGLATTGFPGIGHFSPVGRVNRNKIYVLETDRRNFKPYWLTMDTAIKSMKTIDHDSQKFRGFLWIRSR